MKCIYVATAVSIKTTSWNLTEMLRRLLAAILVVGLLTEEGDCYNYVIFTASARLLGNSAEVLRPF